MNKDDRIISIFKAHGGFARTKELKQAAVHTRDIARLVLEGVLEKIKPGLYRMADLPQANGIPISFIDVCQAVPTGVICLLSALEYYELTTFNPSEVYVALRHSAKLPQIEYPPIRKYFFRDRFYFLGIEEIKTAHGVVRIYNQEKSISDMFRYRNRLGEDIALESLKNYLKRKEVDINKLMEYAVQCQVNAVMQAYVKAMIAQ
ncbi:MAG: type IV toxin-antitoxin system AbiEi family antitoxin domain-containing protein [Candidatus Zhuqueibacterota bacterium]